MSSAIRIFLESLEVCLCSPLPAANSFYVGVFKVYLSHCCGRHLPASRGQHLACTSLRPLSHDEFVSWLFEAGVLAFEDLYFT